MSLSVSDPQDRVEQLIALTHTLTERMTRELAAFEARRPLDVAAELEETARLANLYRHECMRVKANPGLIAEADGASRNRLKDATRGFESILTRHAAGLEAARTFTEGLVRAVAQEVAAGRAAGAGYAASGAATAGDARAVTLNRKA